VAWSFFLLVSYGRVAARDLALDELKERIANTSPGQRPPLCIAVSERQLEAATRLYLEGDPGRAQAALNDVTAYSGMARDYAIQSRKNQKQSEIAIRKMARKLADFKHTVVREDQDRIQESIDRLQSIRDDLLAAMFPSGVKK
jgi:hypothetical protein